MRSGFTISLKMLLFGYFVPSGPRMTCFHTPPTRKSIFSIVVVKPRGPHQFTTCLGFVIASQTSSRGASNSRVMTISRSAVFSVGLFFGAVMFLFPDEFSKRIKATSPAFVVTVAAFDGRKFFVRQSQFRLLAARFEFQRHEHFGRLDFAEFIAAAVLFKCPGENQTFRRFHFAINPDGREKFAVG